MVLAGYHVGDKIDSRIDFQAAIAITARRQPARDNKARALTHPIIKERPWFRRSMRWRIARDLREFQMLRDIFTNAARLTERDVHGIRYYVLMLAAYLCLISFGFGPYIVDDHPFRQTQTALTALYLESFYEIFTYVTPILGPPWTIPFEFPLYQGLAKILSGTSGLPPD
ncbi:MAG: hypothetical protein ACKN9T_09685 [Candidatus Methylumidiphilus sp.]